jgi:hypothetical protein
MPAIVSGGLGASAASLPGRSLIRADLFSDILFPPLFYCDGSGPLAEVRPRGDPFAIAEVLPINDSINRPDV